MQLSGQLIFDWSSFSNSMGAPPSACKLIFVSLSLINLH